MISRFKLEVARAARLTGLRAGGIILFCHIPKCGGTSFRAVIESEYRKRQIFMWYEDPLGDMAANRAKLREAFQRRREEVQLIYGHFAFGHHKRLGVPPYYATILREPVARVLSLYQHFAREPQTPFFPLIKTGLSLRQFVEGRYTEMTNNHMTRILASEPAVQGKLVDDDDVLERAKENIERYFVVVGTMENMDAVMKFLGRRLWWRDHRIPNLNVTMEARSALDEETRCAIVQHNRLDIALYEWVKAQPGGMVAS